MMNNRLLRVILVLTAVGGLSWLMVWLGALGRNWAEYATLGSLLGGYAISPTMQALATACATIVPSLFLLRLAAGPPAEKDPAGAPEGPESSPVIPLAPARKVAEVYGVEDGPGLGRFGRLVGKAQGQVGGLGFR